MSKCISCQADLPPQSRFCGACGTTQPSETSVGEPENIETIRSNPPAENPPANIPPPPPQVQSNTGEIEKGKIAPSGQEENKPPANSSPEQPHNPPSGPQPQPQPLYGDQPQQLQQPYSNYQPQPQPFYSGYPYGPQSQPIYGNYQQPYGNYQQPYGNHQQPPLPSGIQAANTIASGDTGIAGATPITPPGLQVIPTTTPGLQPTPITAPGLQPTPTTTPGPQAKPPAWRIWAIIAVVVVFVLAGTGILAFILIPKPTPIITVTSDYHDNNGKPVGAENTALRIQGKQFAANSAITLLFDGAQFKQDMQPQSDNSGNFKFNLTIPSSWPTGSHILTARDASNNITSTGRDISIVQQGYNSTPGPNGAPTNTANFSVDVDLSMQGSNPFADTYKLDITGQSDSQGGKVCSSGDDGSPQKSSFSLSNGTVVNEASTYTCSGNYKEGQLTYNETLATRVFSTSEGGLCQLANPIPSFLQIKGTYTTSHQFSGDITLSSVAANQYNCSGPLSFTTSNASDGGHGTWTGTVSD
jgi:hypothetical protein